MRTNKKLRAIMIRNALLSLFLKMIDKDESEGCFCEARRDGKTIYRIKIEKEEIKDEEANNLRGNRLAGWM